MDIIQNDQKQKRQVFIVKKPQQVGEENPEIPFTSQVQMREKMPFKKYCQNVLKTKKNVKLTKNQIRVTIQTLRDLGHSIQFIHDATGITYKTVRLWFNRESTKTAEIKEKNYSNILTKYQIGRLINKAKNKNTKNHKVSIKQLRNYVKTQFNVVVCKETIRKLLIKFLGKSYRLKKGISLTEDQKKDRYEFAKMIMERKITHKDLFFTDEKIFTLNTGGSSAYIRLTPDKFHKLRSGDPEVQALMTKPVEKFPKQFMISAGICHKGVSKLIFYAGSQESIGYRTTLKIYKDEMKRLKFTKYFQQDRASSHRANEKYFEEMGIKTTNLPWPVAADCSPIEMLWSIVEAKLDEKTYRSIYQKKRELLRIWESIPLSLVKKLVETFDKRIEYVYKHHGERYPTTYIRGAKKTTDHQLIDWKNVEIGVGLHLIKDVVFSAPTLLELFNREREFIKEILNSFKNNARGKKNFALAFQYSGLKVEINERLKVLDDIAQHPEKLDQSYVATFMFSQDDLDRVTTGVTKIPNALPKQKLGIIDAKNFEDIMDDPESTQYQTNNNDYGDKSELSESLDSNKLDKILIPYKVALKDITDKAEDIRNMLVEQSDVINSINRQKQEQYAKDVESIITSQYKSLSKRIEDSLREKGLTKDSNIVTNFDTSLGKKRSKDHIKNVIESTERNFGSDIEMFYNSSSILFNSIKKQIPEYELTDSGNRLREIVFQDLFKSYKSN